MDCVEAVEVIGETLLGIMMIYMESSGGWKSLPELLMSGIVKKDLNHIILIFFGKPETLVMNRTWPGDLMWLYLPLPFQYMFSVDGESEGISSDDFGIVSTDQLIEYTFACIKRL